MLCPRRVATPLRATPPGPRSATPPAVATPPPGAPHPRDRLLLPQQRAPRLPALAEALLLLVRRSARRYRARALRLLMSVEPAPVSARSARARSAFLLVFLELLPSGFSKEIVHKIGEKQERDVLPLPFLSLSLSYTFSRCISVFPVLSQSLICSLCLHFPSTALRSLVLPYSRSFVRSLSFAFATLHGRILPVSTYKL